MAKNQTSAVDLGVLQTNLQLATNHLRLSERAKIRADQAHTEALELHESARLAFNGAVQTVKSATSVPNLYAA